MILAAVALLVLHNVDGAELLVNPQQIVALQATNEARTGKPNTIMATGHRCIISLTNGKIVSVQESCEAVAKAMESVK